MVFISVKAFKFSCEVFVRNYAVITFLSFRANPTITNVNVSARFWLMKTNFLSAQITNSICGKLTDEESFPFAIY